MDSFEIQTEVPSVEKQSYHLHDEVEIFEERITVNTTHGNISVVREGDPTKRCILTVHDVALNRKWYCLSFRSKAMSWTQTDGNCFESFIHQQDAWEIFKNFHIIHFNCPGQEESATQLDNDVEITIPKLIDQIDEVLAYFHINLALCIGVGLGATILTHYGVCKGHTKLQFSFLFIVETPGDDAGFNCYWTIAIVCLMVRMDPNKSSYNRSTVNGDALDDWRSIDAQILLSSSYGTLLHFIYV